MTTKKWLMTMFLGYSCVLCQAAKVALIPAVPELAPLADQVLAQMSNEPDVEFLERTAIETILKERKLTAAGTTGANLTEFGKTLHADLFAIITAKTAKNGTAASGLIVYDAQTGFRLVNTTLTEQNIVKTIVEQLKKALEGNKHPEQQILLSVAAIRDAGVPERFKYQTWNIAAELERQLSGINRIIVLERDYLDNVNQERKINGQMFKLAPSSQLIRLEFSPGSEPEIVNLTLRVTNAEDKELFRLKLDNCLADTNNSIKKTINALTEYLQLKQPENTIAANIESSRFFDEYTFLNRLGDYTAAQRKLDAAIALDPKKIDYRLASLRLLRNMPTPTYNEMVRKSQRLFAMAQEIERDFPSWHGKLYSDSYYFKWDDITNTMGQASSQDIAALKSLIAQYRVKYGEEIRQFYYKFNISGGVKTHKDLTIYNRYCGEMSRFSLYCDANEWADNLLTSAEQRLELSKAFFLKHPELCNNKDIDDGVSDWFFLLGMEARELSHKPNLNSKQTIDRLFHNSKKYIDTAMTHPLLKTRICALKMELLRKTTDSNYDPEVFRKNMLEYCQKLAVISPETVNKLEDHDINIFWGDRSPLWKISYDVHRNFLAEKQNIKPVNPDPALRPMKELFRDVELAKKPEDMAKKILELAPQLLSYRGQAVTNPDAFYFFLQQSAMLYQYVWRDDQPIYQQAINALNENIIIRTIASLYDKYTSNDGKNKIMNALQQNGKLYLLLQQQMTAKKSKDPRTGTRMGSWSIATVNEQSGKISNASTSSPSAKLSAKGWNRRLPPFAVNGNLAAVGADDVIYLFQFGGTVRTIKDLPCDTIMAVVIMNNRLYAFVGQENINGTDMAKETILFSCKIDGTDRKIHISSSRDDKLNNMDKEKPFMVYSMVADPDKNRLVFNCASPNGSGNVNGLWEFNLNTNSGKCLFEKKWRPIDPVMTVVDKQIFFSFFHEDHCIYDMAKDKGEIFFSIVDKSAKNFIKVDQRNNNGIVYHGPFFARPDQIWFVGRGIQMLTLPDTNRSPIICLPDGTIQPCNNLIFPDSDGKSALIINHCNVFKVTPK